MCISFGCFQISFDICKISSASFVDQDRCFIFNIFFQSFFNLFSVILQNFTND